MKSHIPGWEALFNAVDVFEYKTRELRSQCLQHAAKHSDLIPIIDKQLALFQESKTLYDQYAATSLGMRGWWFGITHVTSITQIAKGFIDLKPADPKNIEDMQFAQNFIHFLATLKNQEEIPLEIGSLLSMLQPIINFYLPEMQDIAEPVKLFKALLDKAIATQHDRMSRYQPEVASTSNINNCTAYNNLTQQQNLKDNMAETILGFSTKHY